MRGQDTVSTHLPSDPRAPTAQPQPRSRSGAGCKLNGHSPAWPLSQPAPSGSSSLRPLPRGRLQHTWAPTAWEDPGHTSWLCPGLPAGRPWEGVGQARGVPPEQWTDRMGQAEAWGCHPQPAVTRSPAGALGSGCGRHRWATASRMLRSKGHGGAEGTGERAGASGLHLPAGHCRGTGHPPGEWLAGARGMAPAKLDPRSHGTAGPGHRGGGGCPMPRLRAHAGYPAGGGCLKPESYPGLGSLVGLSLGAQTPPQQAHDHGVIAGCPQAWLGGTSLGWTPR